MVRSSPTAVVVDKDTLKWSFIKNKEELTDPLFSVEMLMAEVDRLVRELCTASVESLCLPEEIFEAELGVLISKGRMSYCSQ